MEIPNPAVSLGAAKTRPTADALSFGARLHHPASRLLAAILLAVFALGLQTMPLQAQSNVKGRWQTLQTQMPINPVHAALMHNGKILVVSGSGNYPPNTNFAMGVWDPATNTIATQPVDYDMFCNAMVTLPDGRIIVVGGNLQYDPFFGWNRSAIYDPATGKFVDMQDMAHGRWYPTATELADGRIMAFSGLDETDSTNTQIEIYKVGAGWSSPTNSSWTPPLYPRMHLIPNGKVFYSGPTTQSRYFDSSTNTWSGVIATTKYGGTRTYGTSILLPLTPANGYKPRVMIFGGDSPATATTEIIDLSAPTPAWASGPAMSQPRIEMNGTLLPNGKIVLLGGSVNDEDTSSASLNADVFDSNTNTMTAAGAGANAVPRLYHSVSLLLPDGTIWFAGGNPSRGSYEPTVEVYSPAYLFNSDGTLATRPAITGVTPGVVGYGSAFQVQTPDAASISSIVLMKNGAATHAFDMDQRMVGLSFTAGSGVLNVTGPPNANVAPPGYYMMFLINSAGVPSVAQFVQVSTAPSDVPPTGTITSPASNVFIAPGATVSFSGSGTAPSGSIAGYSWSTRGGVPATSSLQNPGSVTFSTPGTYTASLTVTDNAGINDPSPPTRTITVTSTPPPTLASATPNIGNQGQAALSIRLTGTNFQSNPTCSFGVSINVTSCAFNSATQLTANLNILASASAGSRDIVVTNSDGQSSTLPSGFTVQQGTSNPAPTLLAISPNAGSEGQNNISVVLTGTNFLPNPTCDFDSNGGLNVSACVYNSPSQITATVNISSIAFLGGHTVTVTNTDGQFASLSNGFLVNAANGSTVINFSSGFAPGSLVLNGNASINGANLQLTDGGMNEGSTAWFPTPVGIANFVTDFTFQIVGTDPMADGFAFALQNNTTAALGPGGGGLGYGPDTPGGTGGIPNSLAVKFDLYDNVGEGIDSTGLYVNGVSPTTPATDLTGSGIDLHSGHTFHVHLSYDGTNLAMTITDTVNNATFSTTWPINIPNTIGATGAYAGFSGGTGGLVATQSILSWTMSAAGNSSVFAPAFSLTPGTYVGAQTVSLSDATAGATIFYTLDGTTPGTSVGGSTQQYAGPITVSATETISAIATAPNLSNSPVATAAYTIQYQVATPTFLPTPGTYASAQSVNISSTTPGAAIYYTTDGTTPSTASTLYTGPIQVGSNTTIKTIGAATGFLNSSVATGAYTINVPLAATPVISPATGTYTTIQTVSITDATGGAKIYFTTDGTAPTTASTAYSASFAVSSTTTVKAIAVATGFNNSAVATSTITINLPTVATPLISPAAGTYTTPTTVSITDSTPGASIFYTTNGTTPTASSTPYGGSFILSATTTVKAIAIATGFKNSAVASSLFTISLPTVATPVISFTAPQTVSITDATSGASIFYTVDGTTPTASSTPYAGSFLISTKTTVKALATAPGFKNSAVASSVITVNLNTPATPVIKPATGTFTTAQTVTITDTTSGATIFYTTDGTTPTTTSATYPGAFTVNSTTTVKAIAGGSGFKNSAVATSVITVTPPAATPAITPATGTFTSPQSATILDSTPGATIYYTLNGTQPTTASTPYTGAIPVGSTTTIKAIAVAPGFSTSPTASSVITINLPSAATPVIAPATGTYTTIQTVTLTDTTTGATIYYTTDGTTPTVNSTPYAGSFTVSSTTTVKAIAAATGFANSAVATSVLTVNLPPAATPVISPAAGSYPTAQTVSITDTTAGSSIYYTTDGTTPTTSSTRYVTPFQVASSQTIKAIAAATGNTNSGVATAAFSIGSQAVNFAGGFSATNMVFNGSSRLNGTNLLITDDNAAGYEAGAAWYSVPVNIQNFATDFTLQITPGTNPTADGMAFVIQGNTTASIGPAGGGLGYGPDAPTNADPDPNAPIANSVAVKFDLYPNVSEGDNSTGIYTNGASPTVPAADMTGSGVNLHSGNAFKVHITYNGTVLTMTITDSTNSANTFTTSQTVNIPAVVGGTTALVGFTGGTGGLTAIQQVLTWTFTIGGN